jgi:hypothetical protein
LAQDREGNPQPKRGLHLRRRNFDSESAETGFTVVKVFVKRLCAVTLSRNNVNFCREA